ncbi:hybrid sensor histidine kinase/response regulator [Pseudoalteromonas rubra]|uniref:Sensory/regulatory protein RpfC n=1 Tax=Pseudoalteromonas rubra TaxID=43658 RepID=A0A5S3WKI9_9GAMM|nr:response regulator [Pseudoalteromonas rubra]TMP27749.1 hybrid sensor histidine kinase/response regulator [Pseudoalteromonas rubra]TMP32477.1 hybrid sensor histidine kinase/response regulator [Pseudoalteromonas rubra]
MNNNAEKSLFKMSSDKAFYAFLLCSLILSVSLSLVMLSNHADTAIRQVQTEVRQTEARLGVSNLGQFLRTRLVLLKDLAQYPVLANGVMGSDISRASLSDFLGEYRILGKKEPLSMYNVLGEPVYRSGQMSLAADKENDWLELLLDGRLPHAVILKRNAQLFSFVIAVPIEYNGFTEGVLVAEFDTDLANLLALDLSNQALAVELSGQWVDYSNAAPDAEYVVLHNTQMPGTDIHVSLMISQSTIDDSVFTFIVELGQAIFIGLSLSFLLLLFFGRQLLLNPFKRLQTSEQRIKKSEERFKLAIEGSHDGIWDWDIESGDVFYSPRYRELLGYSPSDHKGFPDRFESLEHHLHPKDRSVTFAALQEHLNDKGGFDVEFRLRTRQNDYRYFRSKGLALRNDSGKAIRMSGSLTDITDQKMYQEALSQAKEHNDLLAYAIEACDVGIIISDAKVHGLPLTFINSAFTTITGYGEEVLGTNCKFLQGKETAQEAVGSMVEAIKSRKAHRTVILNYTKLGKPFWNNLHIAPVSNDRGELVAYVGIIQDISEEIAQERALADAKSQAEQASRAKSEFLASMSHEIRTPMNGVLGMLNLLLSNELDEQQTHRVKLAMSSANSLLNLINDILDFSKVDAGKLELEMLDFDLRGMFEDFAESAALQAQCKGLELVLDTLDIEQSMAKGDPSRIRQILANLVGNAIKFTEQGEVIIQGKLTELDNNGLCLECAITDTGIGIPKAKSAALFDSFSQVDSSTTRKYGGTGLGLAIVRKLCQLMGGDVWVESVEGEGSTFKFKLMLEKSAQSKQILPDLDMSKLELLVVDDNQTNRTVLGQQLRHWGAQVFESSSGIAALAECEKRFHDGQRKMFDIALLDMQMPNMDGAQLGKTIKEDKRFKGIKLIMMTSIGHQGDASYFADLGFSGYFPKPATTEDLFNALSVVADDGEALANAKPLVTTHYLKSMKDPHQDTTRVKWAPKPRILLAEDNQVNQIVTVSMLQKLDIEYVDVVGDGNEALRNLREYQHSEGYSLVLMDCQMPEMDGFHATKAIRKGQAGKSNMDITIVALTANAMVGDEKKCLEAGMNDYLSKPVSIEALLSCLKKHLNYEPILVED